MAIWIQSLSLTLIYALGQGFVVYTSLWLVLKLLPTSANTRYHLSLSALTILLAWFAVSWWRQYHVLALADAQSVVAYAPNAIPILQPGKVGVHFGARLSILSSLRVIFPWLSTFYILGLTVTLVRLSAGMRQLFWLKKSGVSKPEKVLDELLATLKCRLCLESKAQILISAKAHVPMVIGFLKPIILMPAAAVAHLSAEQLETIILHELAHIKRHDYLVNILQAVVETVLFFNPFVWMISSITRREREYCCDDLVLAHTGEPLFYATALASLISPRGSASPLAVAATGPSNQMFNRIQRIMELKKNPFSYSRMVAALLIIATIAYSTAWFTPAFAKFRKDKPGKATAGQTAAVQKNAGGANLSDENLLVDRLMSDHLIDQVKGFVVEKKQKMLFINGQQQTEEIAGKYLQSIKKDIIRVEIYPLLERLNQHPDATFLQILLPSTFSSPCVNYSVKDSC